MDQWSSPWPHFWICQVIVSHCCQKVYRKQHFLRKNFFMSWYSVDNVSCFHAEKLSQTFWHHWKPIQFDQFWGAQNILKNRSPCVRLPKELLLQSAARRWPGDSAGDSPIGLLLESPISIKDIKAGIIPELIINRALFFTPQQICVPCWKCNTNRWLGNSK